MKGMEIKKLIRGGILALAVFWAGMFSQGFFQEPELQERLRILSDCFLFPAILLGGTGLLSLIAREGAFDLFGYGISVAVRRILHPLHPPESFYEYKTEKAGSRGSWKKEDLATGTVCLCFSFLFLFLYLRCSG